MAPMSATLPHLSELDLLARISHVLDFEVGLNARLSVIIKVASELMRNPLVCLLLLDENRDRLHVAASLGPEQTMAVEAASPLARSLSGRAIQTKAPQAVADLGQDHSFGLGPAARKDGVVSLLSLPLMVRGQAIGVIHSGDIQLRSYSEDEVKLLALIGNQAAAAVANARLQAFKAAQQLTAPQDRELLARAKAVLMRRRNVDEPGADQFIQAESAQRSRTVRDIARTILLSESLATQAHS